MSQDGLIFLVVLFRIVLRVASVLSIGLADSEIMQRVDIQDTTKAQTIGRYFRQSKYKGRFSSNALLLKLLFNRR